MDYLMRGILIGVLFGIPVGAVGALTVQRTWSAGIRAGLLTGLGSSAADCFYAGVGAFGMTFVSDFLLRYQEIITALGGCVIVAAGMKSLCLSPEQPAPETAPQHGARMFLTSFVIGLTNPAAVLTFLFAFSYFGIAEVSGRSDGILLTAGVFLGTFFWWSALSVLIYCIKKQTVGIPLQSVNRIFGGILCVFGAAVLIRLLF